MHRRVFMGGLLLGPLAAAAPAVAKSRTGREVPLVGVLAATGLSALDYLRDGLRTMGYVDGKSVDFAFRSADGNPRDLPGLARHLARLDVDVLFVSGPAALDAAVHATSAVPIVALDLETDPLRSGLVRSLEHPRTNVTGVFLDQNAMAGKWLEMMRLTLPQARQLNLLWDASSGPWQLGAAKLAARRLAFDTDTLVVRSERDFERELTDGMGSKPDALVLLSSPLVRARSLQIAEFSAMHQLPTISPFSDFPRAGGLMSYGPNVKDFYLRAAVFVDKVLKGSRAGDQAISMPTQFERVVNQRTAKALGLTLPPALLAGGTIVLA